jgi:hypothetical protein
MNFFKIFIVIATTASSIAFAHSGVKDQNVKERMLLMKAMAERKLFVLNSVSSLFKKDWATAFNFN